MRRTKVHVQAMEVQAALQALDLASPSRVVFFDCFSHSSILITYDDCEVKDFLLIPSFAHIFADAARRQASAHVLASFPFFSVLYGFMRLFAR